MILLRLLANVIDWLVFAMIFMALFFGFQHLTPAQYFEQDMIHWGFGIAWLLLMVIVPLGLNYPFMIQGQTIGKAFFALQVRITDTNEPLDFWPMFQREILAKLMSCYIICLPLFFSRQAKYDEAIGAQLIVKKRGS